MRSYEKILKELDHILMYEDLEDHSRCNLLRIKKGILNGCLKYNDSFSNTEIIPFFKFYIEHISKWLNIPVDEVDKKIKFQRFTDIECKLIVTNIMILENLIQAD